jgi:4-hydroxymandelate synthase
MAVLDIEYVEYFTGDAAAAAEYFTELFGFTPVARNFAAATESLLLTQGTVQLVLTSGRATEEFLAAHGDGVADIALSCDDPERTLRTAATAGAVVTRSEQGRPVVSGFGDVCHTLLTAHRSAGSLGRLPHGPGWRLLNGVHGTAGTAASGRRPGRVQLLDHVAVCIEGETLSEVADYYTAALGLERFSSEYVTMGDQAMDSIVVRSDSGLVTFTLVAPVPGKSPGQLDGFLGRNAGPGVQHLAFLVDEIIPAVREYQERGVEFLDTPSGYYDALAERFAGMREEIDDLRSTSVLADRDEWGYLLQLFTRSVTERNTMFCELIQRRGSKGFGSSNIRALYEAVERDRIVVE